MTMTSYDRSPDFERIVDEVFSLINEEWLTAQIDVPLHSAAATFDVREGGSRRLSSRAFLDLAAEFVAHLSRWDANYSIELTPRQARAQAAFILEHTYQGHHAGGYTGALEDARAYGKEGLKLVLFSIVEVLAATQRQDHTRWVIATKIECLPWPVRRDLAAFILSRWAPLFPPPLRECRPELLAGLCPQLIQSIASSERAIRELFASPLRNAAQGVPD
jgi:hypothetical protein